jgi:hypothetical protein
MGIQERKEREKERRRQQIMVAAKRVFTDKGFSRATMEDIAQEAELSPAPCTFILRIRRSFTRLFHSGYSNIFLSVSNMLTMIKTPTRKKN